MAGHLEDPSQWKLTTASGVPYKIKQMEGSFQQTTGSVTLTVLIPSDRLFDFAEEMLPPPVQFGQLYIPRYTKFPGANLVVTNLRFKSFDDQLPIDPFGFDSSPGPNTYFGTIEVVIDFGPQPHQDPQPNDPKTFLEVSGSTTGEFIHTTGASITWIEESDKTEDDEESSASSQSSMSTTRRQRGRVNRTPHVPSTIMAPLTQWDVKWKMVPYNYFVSVLKPRINLLLGKVNSHPFSVCFATTPTTLLFASHSFNYSFSWRNGFVENPLVDVTFKFIEKRILWQGRVMGHNDAWKPGVGWSGILIGGKPPYERINFNSLFTQ